eukprot:12418675-Karenia_brevis.AAC.1
MHVGDLEPLGGPKVYKIQVPIGDPKYTREIASIWKDLCATSEDYRYKGRGVWVHAERSEAEQKRYATAGRFKAFIQSKMDADGQVDCSWHPDFNITLKKNEINVLLAQVSESGELETDDEKTQLAFGTTREALLAELQTFKQ